MTWGLLSCEVNRESLQIEPRRTGHELGVGRLLFGISQVLEMTTGLLWG